jgi:predicted DNA-binding protein with PD1-like motif
MNVREANRARHLVIRLDRGDELPAALVRALDEAEARSAWITGVGALEAAEIALYDQGRRAYGDARRIDRPTEVVALSGNVSVLEGTTIVRLSATLAREGDVGLELFGGQLVWGRAFALELCVTVFDDLALTRVADERTGLPLLSARDGAVLRSPRTASASAEAPAPPPAPAHVEPPRAYSPPPPAAPPPSPPPPPVHAPAAPNHTSEAPALPQRPQKPRDDIEVYPEVGDKVTHFHFGECTVITSDGDRIRLRQDKDGRVREVALTMLKIEAPTIAADGSRHFKLGRKH